MPALHVIHCDVFQDSWHLFPIFMRRLSPSLLLPSLGSVEPLQIEGDSYRKKTSIRKKLKPAKVVDVLQQVPSSKLLLRR